MANRAWARALRVAVSLSVVIGACATAISAVQDDVTRDDPATANALSIDGPGYPVSAFELRYVRENPGHPDVTGLMGTEVQLGWTTDGYVAPRENVSGVMRTPGEAANRGTETYYASALQRVLESLRDALVARELMGVYVAPDPSQIDETGADLRPAGQTSLTILITTGIVTELRTLGSGERVGDKVWGGIAGGIKPDDRINNKAHASILRNSPIQPVAEGEETDRSDLMRKDELDRYLFHLSRHPGRRVDASVAASPDAGGVSLDYMVTENRPLTLYAQISNTGTKSTDYWRQRFGLFHTQLTNNDDVLSLDYVTSWFDKTNQVFGAYEAPFPNDRFRWRVHGMWGEFTADEVGFFGDEFEGEEWGLGAEIIWNFYQRRELFVDAFAGVRWHNIAVDNEAAAIEGEEDFIIPSVGLRLDRRTEWATTSGSISLEAWLADADSFELSALGRTLPDEDAVVLQGELSQSVYLEPLLNWDGWADPSTPDDSTLAHELYASIRGQYAFDNRLIPQAAQVVGGLYTVRGYPESATVGDSVVIGTLEYRLHVPRLFAIETEPRQFLGRDFRRAPQYVYGAPDWDLILKGFVDVGRTYQSDRFFFEEDDELLGVGVGIELLYRRNLSIRLDWGFALEELESAGVNDGSNRLHFVATILF